MGSLQAEYVGENYNAEVGYVPRTRYYKFDTTFKYLFFPGQDSKVLSHGPSIGSIQYFNFEGAGIDRGTELGYEVNFKNRSEMMLTFENQFIVLQSPFDPIRTGIRSLEALTEHRWNSINFEYNSKPQSLFTYALKSSYGGYFQDGKRWLFFSEMGYRFQPYVELNSLVSYNHIRLEEPYREPMDSGCWGLNRISLLPKIFSFPISINTTSNKSCGILIPVFNGDINLHRIFFWCLTAAIPICWYPTEIGT